MEHIVTKENIEAYCAALHAAERAGSTIVKYRRELNQLAIWLAGRPASQERLAAWKAALAAQGYAPCTINAMLAAANGFFGYMGWEIHLKLLKLQRRLFRDTARELSRAEYERLLAAAKDSGQERLALIMETLCATGIRISELRYMTVEAAQTGQATIALKGKIRTILLSTKLCRKLLQYAKKHGMTSGEIFCTRSGRGISRRQVWHELKRLCKRAGVAASKAKATATLSFGWIINSSFSCIFKSIF